MDWMYENQLLVFQVLPIFTKLYCKCSKSCEVNTDLYFNFTFYTAVQLHITFAYVCLTVYLKFY